MAIRTSVAALMSITVLFAGLYAVSESAQQHESGINSSAAENASKMADGVFGGIFQAGQGVVWFGVAAVVMVALAFLVYVGTAGGR